METLRLTKWEEFRTFVRESKAIYPFYWRGQGDPSWPLASSFERIILNLNGGWKEGKSQIYPYDGRYTAKDDKKFWAEGFYQSIRDSYLESFKDATKGLRGHNPKDLTTDQWWALGRHHGLMTPLLDWTTKPYIAAFFALTGLYEQMRQRGGITFEGKECAIYRLFHNNQLEGDGLRIVKPIVDELGRMQGQRGLFSWLDSEDFFELQGFLDSTNRETLLTQVILSDQAVMDGLKDLDSHGIDYRLLFPDLIGAAQYANARGNVPI